MNGLFEVLEELIEDAPEVVYGCVAAAAPDELPRSRKDQLLKMLDRANPPVQAALIRRH